MGKKRLFDLAEKLKVYSEKTLLKNVIRDIEQGRWVGVECGGDVKLLVPRVCVGYPLMRSLGDLPLISPLKFSPDLPIEDALKNLERSEKEYALLVKEGKVLGLVLKKKLVEEILKEIEEKRKIETYLNEVLNRSLSFVVEFFLPEKEEKDEFSIKKVKIQGPVEKITGYPAQTFLFSPYFFLSRVHPDDREKLKNARKKLLKQKMPQTISYRFCHSDGEWLYLQEYIYPVRDKKGNVRSLQCLITDISFSVYEKKKKEFLFNLQNILLKTKPEKALGEALAYLAKEFFFIDAAIIFLWRKKGRFFKVVSKWVGERCEEKFEKMIEDFSRGLKLGELSLEVRSKKESFYIQDTEKSPLYSDKILSKFDWKSRYIFPLILKDDVYVFLVFLSQKTSAFSEKELSLFYELSFIFYAVVDVWMYQEELKEVNASLEEKVRQRTYELQVLYELSQKIGFTLNYDELFYQMVQYLSRVISYDVASTLLFVNGVKEFFIYPMKNPGPGIKEKIQEHMFKTAKLLTGEIFDKSEIAVKIVESQKFKKSWTVKK